MCESFKLGARVLLRKLDFRGRQKLSYAYHGETFLVTWVNPEGDVYRIQPSQGGTERTINRKLLRLHPSELSYGSVTSGSSSESEYDFTPGSDLGQFADAKDGRDSTDKEGEQSSPGVTLPLRRSPRSIKGVHSNPYHQPHSVIK